MLKRLGFAIECAGLLYIVCAFVAFISLWRQGVMSLFPILGILSAPALAALLFICVGVLVPGLLSPGRFAKPLNVTLPIVYGGLIFVTSVLGPGTQLSILRLHDVYAFSLQWVSPYLLLSSVLLQVLVLTGLARAERRSEKGQPVE